MLLLLELHGDLPDDFPTDERRLYLFGCPRKPCNRKPGSIRAFRATRKVAVGSGQQHKQDEPKEEQETQPAIPEPPKQDLGASLFGATNLTSNVSSNPNPFSSNSGPTPAGSNPFATPVPSTAPVAEKPAQSTSALASSFADKVRISSPPPSAATKQAPESVATKPWPAQSAFPPPYTKFYLDAEYETLSRPSSPTVPENVKIEPMEEEGAGGAELKDTFESEVDKDFMKFSMRLEHNPEQVLRYEFRGTPLLYSTTDAVGSKLHVHNAPGAKITTLGAGSIPACEYCGSQRVFELQLVPHTITMLEEGRAGVGLGKDDAGMEWGTIIMGVCGKNCAPQELGVTGWREEWAGVQWEQMQ